MVEIRLDNQTNIMLCDAKAAVSVRSGKDAGLRAYTIGRDMATYFFIENYPQTIQGLTLITGDTSNPTKYLKEVRIKTTC